MSFCGPHSLYHVDCDVGQLACADIEIVNALARASLNARRQGERLRVVNPSLELRELIAFSGLDAVLLGRRRRQAEEREEPLGVEERGKADDLPV
jgi:STAS domain